MSEIFILLEGFLCPQAPLQPVVDTEGRQEGLRFRLRKGSVEESPFLGATPPFPGAPSPQKKAIKMKLSTGESQVVRWVEFHTASSSNVREA